jgi:undecaprenyl diphosphate synthase
VKIIKNNNEITNRNYLPKHLAIIMDGNGRWAIERGLPRTSGHKEGAKAVRRIINDCISLKIPTLTLYAFSTENWKRPKSEVLYLINLFKNVLIEEKEHLINNRIKVNFLGRSNFLPKSLIEKMQEIKNATNKNSVLSLNIAINYGGRAEIVDAIKKIASKIVNKKLSIDEIDENTVKENLYIKQLPDPDLLIRTGNEMRISNFMLWQIAYTELYVSSVYWPDFDRNKLMEAISNFQKRTRKYGGKV